MTNKLEFKHQFVDQSEYGTFSFDTDPSKEKRINVQVDEKGNIWLSCNKKGWLHLAKVCAELGLADFEPGYHFHKTFDFDTSDGTSPEINFEVNE